MNVEFRDYAPERDREAAHRIWTEVGWLEKGKEAQMDAYVECGAARVAAIDGQAECLVTRAPGDLRYQEERLSATVVTGVTTGRVARKQGFAARLLAQSLAQDAAAGAAIAVLGMFEQGFYNRLGFGTGCYEHIFAFDPAHLRAKSVARVPKRLCEADGPAMHRARLARLRTHGSLSVLPEAITTSECSFRDGFALGYADGPGGALTHFAWCHAKDAEHGPYDVTLVYATWAQFHELLALLRNLGDQVHLVTLAEPPLLQLQDLIDQPFKHRRVTKRSQYEASCRACGYWQARILDLDACLENTHLDGPSVRFNLELRDPIQPLLEPNGWQGVAGSYAVTLGPESAAVRGGEPGLPTLRSSVGAFTRMWLGVRPASSLAVTDELEAAEELLRRLDRVLALPSPDLDWSI